ncbi:XdhC family protein [Streptomyces sp. NBC_01314]|uniref:XdhC family protein n=1 Tax=Streptomyces sp. NBC_01314 TaxID=2903821 RepID=UPI00352E806B
MRATLMCGARDVRVEDVPDSVIKQPTDALVRVTASCVWGSDLWPYGSKKREDGPARLGHRALALPVGYVIATGSRRTHDERLRFLDEAGVSGERLARLPSPIGLDLGAPAHPRRPACRSPRRSPPTPTRARAGP